MKYNVFNIKNHKLIPIGLSMCLLMIGANLFAHEGALTGVFSISDTEKVNFSKGNLQYQASTHTWRFADQQYNIIGSSGNSKASSTYDGWIDWFAWGTSGWNSGAKYYQPWEIQPTWDGDDFNPGGSTTSDLTGTFQNADWGVYNAISNGGNTAGQWRVLSKDECYYLFNNRANAQNLFFFATVGGIRGLVVLPDNWNFTSFSFIKNKNEYYGDNAISATDWTNWEQSGAVFLPSSEVRGYDGTCDGKYWTSTHCTDAYSSNEATTLNFRNYSVNDYIYKVFANECTYRSERIYVRLVQTASNNNHILLFNNNYPESNRTNLYVGCEYFSPDINVVFDPVSGFTSINGTQKKDVECTPFELIGIHSGDKISIRVYNYIGSRSHTIPACGVIDIVNKEGNNPSPRQWMDFITSEKDTLSNISITDSYKYLKLWLYSGGNDVVFSDYKFLVQVEKGETLSAVPSSSGHTITYGTKYGTLPQPPSRKGYTFEGWYTDSLAGTQITSSTIVTTTDDQILYAHWKRNQNSILVSGTNGIISGAGTYFYGDTAILVATPDIGYHFAQWSDGNTDNPRQVVVTQDSTFTAEFAKQIDSTQIIDVAVYGDCSQDGYNKDLTHIAAVNSSSGRTSCEWVQLWENGPKWATFNVGATITDYANLTVDEDPIAFNGYTKQAPYYNTANVGGLYAWNNTNLNGRKITWNGSASTGISDVATTLWGSDWKTPTKAQLDTLQKSSCGKTTWTWCDGSTTQYVVGCTLKGYKVSGVGDYANYSIFLPAAGYFYYDYGTVNHASDEGYYWSSTKYESYNAYYLGFRLDSRYIYNLNRWFGLSVRAVLADNTVPTDNVTLTLKTNDCETYNVITCIKEQPLRITATDSECSKFVRWSDGNTDNPRVVSISGNCAYTAIFETINYTITLDADEEKGEVVKEK